MSMVKLTFSARAMLLAMIASAFVVSSAASAVQAQPNSSEVVDALESQLAAAHEIFEDQKQLLQMEIVNTIQAAQDAGDLKLVLKLEKQFTKRIGKTFNPQRKQVAKLQKSALKQVKKNRKNEDNLKNAGYAEDVRELVADQLARIDEFERQLRFQVSNAVEAAVNALTR